MPSVPFPHMMWGDIPLFSAYVLKSEARRFTRWEFDTHLGQGHLAQPEFNESILALSLEVTRLRVDAIGFDGSFPTLIEVKPRARLSAFGQVLAYQYFYKLERQVVARMMIITDSITPDTAQLFAAHGIEVQIVEPTDQDGIIAACHIVKRECSQRIRIPIP